MKSTRPSENSSETMMKKQRNTTGTPVVRDTTGEGTMTRAKKYGFMQHTQTNARKGAMTSLVALAATAAFLLAIPLGCTKNDDKATLPQEAPPVKAAEKPADAPAPAAAGAAAATPGEQLASNGNVGIASNSPGTPPAASGGAGDLARGRDTVSRVSGQINAAKQGEVSFRVAGHVSRNFVNVGDRVKKGQVLAQLDDTDNALRARLANVQVDQAKIQFEQAKRDLEREQQLRKEGATTQTSFERQSNTLASTQLALAQAQIAAEQARKAVTDTRLVAAYDGIVSKRMKVEGEFVGVGAPVYQVSASGELEVNLRVPEGLLRKVTPGQKVRISIPSIDRETEMEVQRIVPVIQENSRTFEVIGRIVRGDAAIVPGQFVEAQF